MATNFMVKIGKIGLFTFLCSLGSWHPEINCNIAILILKYSSVMIWLHYVKDVHPVVSFCEINFSDKLSHDPLDRFSPNFRHGRYFKDYITLSASGGFAPYIVTRCFATRSSYGSEPRPHHRLVLLARHVSPLIPPMCQRSIRSSVIMRTHTETHSGSTDCKYLDHKLVGNYSFTCANYISKGSFPEEEVIQWEMCQSARPGLHG